MTQNYVVPAIYTDRSDQYQGYFAFRFTCEQCYWQIDTRPIRSNVSMATNVMDVGIGFLGGFWGRAAEVGEKMYGTQWHTEQVDALQRSWAEIQSQFHLCPKCHRTVCMRCFNTQLNLCTGPGCAPDLKAYGTQAQHELNVNAQRQQIEQNYHAPQFNIAALPSAVTPDLVQQQPRLPQGVAPSSAVQPLSPTIIAGFGTPGYPQGVACPNCRRMGPPGKFCQDCGTKLPMPDLFCPKCAVPVENTARFCAECGTQLHIGT